MRTLFAGTCKYLEVTFIWLAFLYLTREMERHASWHQTGENDGSLGNAAPSRFATTFRHAVTVLSQVETQKSVPVSVKVPHTRWCSVRNWESIFAFFCRVNGRNNESPAKARSPLANARPHLRTLYGICQHRFKDPHLGHFVQRERSDKNTDKSSSSLKAP